MYLVSRLTAKSLHWRIFIIFGFFSVFSVSILARLFSLQILDYRQYVEAAADQHENGAFLPPKRGTIYFQDREGNLQIAAINKDLYTLKAVPKNIKDAEEAASLLSEILKIPREELLTRLSKKDDVNEIIQRKVEDEAARKIAALDIKGIYLDGESRRLYPSEDMAAHVLGFVKFENDIESGQYGIERLYERELKGETGFLEGIGNSAASILQLGKRIMNPPKDGKEVVLTIDYNIQKRTDEKLKAVSEKWQAERAVAIIVDPMTGKILALSSYPNFDPNTYGKTKDLSTFLNPAVEATYELGSVLKPITMAAGINEYAIIPETAYNDTGEVKIGGYTIRNYDLKSHGTQTMTNVLEKSLNTGVVFVEKRLGHSRFRDYLKKFGFGKKTEVDLPGEVSGNISNLESGKDIDFATASFGQGIAMSPMQLSMAVSAIANGGNLMRPYIVHKVKDDSGNEQVFGPEVREAGVISKETAETVSKMLVSVTRQGFENKAGVKDYFVAGKTGTAQIPKPNGKGYSEEYIHSFVGYAPAFEPKFLIYLQLIRPKGVNFASTSLTPTFHDLASYILNYYNVPPDEK